MTGSVCWAVAQEIRAGVWEFYILSPLTTPPFVMSKGPWGETLNPKLLPMSRLLPGLAACLCRQCVNRSMHNCIYCKALWKKALDRGFTNPSYPAYLPSLFFFLIYHDIHNQPQLKEGWEFQHMKRSHTVAIHWNFKFINKVLKKQKQVALHRPGCNRLIRMY